MVTTEIEKIIKGVGIIVVAITAIAYENTFKNKMPYLENEQVII